MNTKELLEKYDSGERDFSLADLSGVNLSGANLSGANLSKADLRWANLSRADLSRADLRWANLSRADLSEANLSKANLRGANLSEANLRGANIDFSCWPLWCGSKKVKVDIRLVYQLLAHVVVLECDNPEFATIRELIMPYATKCHRAEELGLCKDD